jgi:hypothetical protein
MRRTHQLGKPARAVLAVERATSRDAKSSYIPILRKSFPTFLKKALNSGGTAAVNHSAKWTDKGRWRKSKWRY